MRRLYIVVSMLFFLSILLFISTFIYLDRARHKQYYFTVNLDGHDIGTVKIDKFLTEDKLIYKSVSDMPFYPMLTDSKSRLALDRRYNLESYSKVNSGRGAREEVYLEMREDAISFVSTFQSEFDYLDKIPIRRGTFVFEEDSPATYLPILENYDFRKGRSQGFNAIIPFSTSLPPMKRFVTLTSIRDEYVKIDSKKIKTEYMLLKIKNYPQGSVWASKSDRSLIAIEIPDRGLKFTRAFSPKSVVAKEYIPTGKGYVAKDVSFKNKNVQLAGTLTIPEGESRKHPAVLLIWGPGPQDREYQGLFTSIAGHLSRNGFCVLRFDKRGIGSSGGDFSSTTASQEIEDLNIALEYLAGQKEVDPDNIFIVGHSKGAFYASEIASKEDKVKGLVLMAPLASLGMDVHERNEELKRMASRFKWSDDYLKLAMKSNLETIDRIKGTRNNWISILGKRCFLKRMREEMAEDPVEAIKKVRVPVLILQGKEDDIVPIESASILDKALAEAGNENHTLVYFGYLGHLFGESINDGVHRIHNQVDGDLLVTIRDWLKGKVRDAPSQTQK